MQHLTIISIYSNHVKLLICTKIHSQLSLPSPTQWYLHVCIFCLSVKYQGYHHMDESSFTLISFETIILSYRPSYTVDQVTEDWTDLVLPGLSLKKRCKNLLNERSPFPISKPFEQCNFVTFQSISRNLTKRNGRS